MRTLAAFLVLVLCLVYEAQGQTVAQQCLAQFVPNRRAGAAQGQQTPQQSMIEAFRAICRQSEEYVRCFENGLRNSNDQRDFFLWLIYDAPSMNVAYRGFCADLPDIEPRIQCLLNNNIIQQCYDDFNRAVTQVGTLRQQNVGDEFLRNLACNVSVSRYQCEINAYRNCDPRASEIMSNFYFAGLPNECQRITRVFSLYDALYASAVTPYVLPITMITLVVTSILYPIADVSAWLRL